MRNQSIISGSHALPRMFYSLTGIRRTSYLEEEQRFDGALTNINRPNQLIKLRDLINLTNLKNLGVAKFGFVFKIWSVNPLMTKMSITSIGPRQLKQKKHFVDIKNRFWYLHWKIILIYQCFEKSYHWILFIWVYFCHYYSELRHSEYILVPATILQALFCLIKW